MADGRAHWHWHCDGQALTRLSVTALRPSVRHGPQTAGGLPGAQAAGQSRQIHYHCTYSTYIHTTVLTGLQRGRTLARRQLQEVDCAPQQQAGLNSAPVPSLMICSHPDQGRLHLPGVWRVWRRPGSRWPAAIRSLLIESQGIPKVPGVIFFDARKVSRRQAHANIAGDDDMTARRAPRLPKSSLHPCPLMYARC